MGIYFLQQLFSYHFLGWEFFWLHLGWQNLIENYIHVHLGASLTFAGVLELAYMIPKSCQCESTAEHIKQMGYFSPSLFEIRSADWYNHRKLYTHRTDREVVPQTGCSNPVMPLKVWEPFSLEGLSLYSEGINLNPDKRR